MYLSTVYHSNQEQLLVASQQILSNAHLMTMPHPQIRDNLSIVPALFSILKNVSSMLAQLEQAY